MLFPFISTPSLRLNKVQLFPRKITVGLGKPGTVDMEYFIWTITKAYEDLFFCIPIVITIYISCIVSYFLIVYIRL